MAQRLTRRFPGPKTGGANPSLLTFVFGFFLFIRCALLSFFFFLYIYVFHAPYFFFLFIYIYVMHKTYFFCGYIYMSCTKLTFFVDIYICHAQNLLFLLICTKQKGVTGIEPATMGSAIPCSTTELRTHISFFFFFFYIQM